ncbi:MAG: hypothetical protein NVSMB58_18020 [Terriglobales bacterium]
MTKHNFPHPGFDGFAHFLQPPFKEMVGALDNRQSLGLRKRRDYSLQLGLWTKLIAPAAHKELRLYACFQEFEFVVSALNGGDRDSQPNHGSHPLIGARGSQAYRRTERETGKQQGQMKLLVNPIESGPHVFNFTSSLIMHALAQSGSAKIEP